MMKKTLALLAVGSLMTGSAFAAEPACCATTTTKAANESASCMNLVSLHLNPDQQTKLSAWQDECTKAGCTKKSRTAFMKKAQGVLSKEQYATLKSECDKSMANKS